MTTSPDQPGGGASTTTTSEKLDIDDIEMAKKRARLSFASRAFDRGDKGYLDDIEQVVRDYDKDGDGKFSVEEVFSMASDIIDSRRKEEKLQKWILGGTLAFVLLLASVLGMTWTTVALSRKVTTDESTNNLVSDKTGHVLGVHPNGDWSVIDESGEPDENDPEAKLFIGTMAWNNDCDDVVGDCYPGICQLWTDIEKDSIPVKISVFETDDNNERIEYVLEVDTKVIHRRVHENKSVIFENVRVPDPDIPDQIWSYHIECVGLQDDDACLEKGTCVVYVDGDGDIELDGAVDQDDGST